MEQGIDLRVWFAGGVIFIFVFLIGLNRSMQRDAKPNQERSGDEGARTNRAIQSDSAPRRR